MAALVKLAVAANPTQIATGISPADDRLIARTLHVMDVDTTWTHPDIYWEYFGMHRYAHGEFPKAMAAFLRSAYYADKLSELYIGLMYLNGEGVPADPITASAWLEIAAERGYPKFVGTRDRVMASLTSEQRKRAHEIHDRLAETYADVVAKPRMAQQLRFAIEGITGSHVGFNPSLLNISLHDPCAPDKPRPIQMPEWGCAGIYSMHNLDPKTYFAERDSAWLATVTVDPIQPQGEATDNPKALNPAVPVDLPKQ